MAYFKNQLKKLNAFYKNSTNSPKITHAVASRSTVSSTSQNLRPCLSTNLFVEDRGWVHLTVPSGTSAGIHEPSSLSKKGEFPVLEKESFDTFIKNKLIGIVPDPIAVDEILENVNKSLPIKKNKRDTPFSRISGPTATATSLAVVLASAYAVGVSVEVAIHYFYNKIAKENDLPKASRMSLPIYMSKIADGGVHGALDTKNRPLNPIQEFLYIPIGYDRYTDALEATMEVNARFWRLIKGMNFDIKIGAEGGITSLQLTSAIQVLQLMTLAIRGNGRDEKPLAGMFIGLDIAAGELYNYDDSPGMYYLGKDGLALFNNQYVDYKTLTEYYQKLIKTFPIISIEDPYSDEDECLEHWKYGFPLMNKDILVITDDFTVTQPDRVKIATPWGSGGLLTKVNQGGTFTRTAKAMQIAKKNDWVRILSHRSCEAAEFAFESIFALAVGAEFCKVTVGSRDGGGGGREARVNWISNANVIWNSIMKDIKKSDPEFETIKNFWGENIPESKKISGLPYQGTLLQNAKNPPPWLKRVNNLIKVRYEQAKNDLIPIYKRPSYSFGALSSDMSILSLGF